ncbi:MAG: phosphoglycerate kinase [Patescibacteria group bacterium]
MRSISEIQNFEGQKVLVRVDWNVPHDNEKILDTSRIDVTLETIRWITERNGSVIIISHFGREGESMENLSKLVAEILPLKFIGNPFNENGKMQISIIKPGEIVVLENIRTWPEEEKDDDEFAKQLASLGNIYVNEAFSASHRKHASIVGLPKYLPSFSGLYFIKETENLSKAFDPKHPFFFILGGAKLETKLPLVKNFLDMADDIFIGGALAKPALETELSKNSKIILPVGDAGALDANRETLDVIIEKANKAKFILWAGPLGKYEDGFTKGTNELALSLAKIVEEKEVEIIIGGGDTEKCISSLNIKEKFAWVSLAGGAMLEFLTNRTLPGIEALDAGLGPRLTVGQVRA